MKPTYQLLNLCAAAIVALALAACTDRDELNPAGGTPVELRPVATLSSAAPDNNTRATATPATRTAENTAHIALTGGNIDLTLTATTPGETQGNNTARYTFGTTITL